MKCSGRADQVGGRAVGETNKKPELVGRLHLKKGKTDKKTLSRSTGGTPNQIQKRLISAKENKAEPKSRKSRERLNWEPSN